MLTDPKGHKFFHDHLFSEEQSQFKAENKF